MSIHANGRLSDTAQVSDGSPAFDAILSYWNSNGVADGRATFNAYAPGLIIETETMQVNILRTQVVVATRSDANHPWHPVVRDKGAEELRLEAAITHLLNSPSK